MLLAIDLDELRADVVEDGERRNFCAHENLREHAHLEREGNVDGGLDGIAEAVVEHVGDDADDLEPAVAVGSGGGVGRLILQEGTRTCWPMGFALGKSCFAIVWLMTASGAPRMISG